MMDEAPHQKQAGHEQGARDLRKLWWAHRDSNPEPRDYESAEASRLPALMLFQHAPRPSRQLAFSRALMVVDGRLARQHVPDRLRGWRGVRKLVVLIAHPLGVPVRGCVERVQHARRLHHARVRGAHP